MGETRVNLQHLLEDIRDTYPFPAEEAILTELVANSLDSGASEIRFLVSKSDKTCTAVDNGKGMSPSQLEHYHDIAATTKVRGKGIGFAGIGAKLALLVARDVITETRAGRSYTATRWRLESSQRAQWELVEPQGILENAKSGTAVTLVFREASPLVESNYVEMILQAHFHPLLDETFGEILRSLYSQGIRFFVNHRPIAAPELAELRGRRIFVVRASLSSNPNVKGKPVGVGFIGRSNDDLPETQYGIGISAYGKVIKRGWDWIGLTPKHPTRLSGIVEVPPLVEILTTNKADFLKDGGSLKRYYRYRKAIQAALSPILRDLGETVPVREREEREVRPLEREVERVLGTMLGEYPEIAPLIGRRRTSQPGVNLAPDAEGADVGALTETLAEIAQQQGNVCGSAREAPAPFQPPPESGAVLEQNPDGTEAARPQEGKRVGPGLMIGFEDSAERAELGWLLENTVWINRAHPAYQKAVAGGHEQYHVVLTVAWVLLGHLDDQHSAQRFIGEFLFGWGARK
jgi:hypothetical protein